MPTEQPISDVVVVNITRDTLFTTGQGFSTQLIVGNTDLIDHGERARYYTSPEAVDDDFASTDEESIAAGIAFSQKPRPARIAIGRALDADAAGFIRGDQIGLLATWQAVSDGTFAVSIDGVAQDITGLDFSPDTSLDDVAATIQTALQLIGAGGFTAALCVLEGAQLKISSGTTGALSSVEPLVPVDPAAGTDVSGATFANAGDGVATVVAGHAFTDMAGELSAIENVQDDWYGFTLTHDIRNQANIMSAAAWAQPRKKLFGTYTNQLIAFDPSSSLDIGSLLGALLYDRTFIHWGNEADIYPEVSTLARLATVDYQVPNSAITVKFKEQPGVPLADLTGSQRTALLDKSYNIQVSRGGKAGIEEGTVANGEFIDVIHSLDWLEDAIATGVYDVVASAPTKIPMTDPGVAILQTEVEVHLGVATAAVILASQVVDGELLPAFTTSAVSMADYPDTLQKARIGPPISFEGRIAGAIHKQTISGNVSV